MHPRNPVRAAKQIEEHLGSNGNTPYRAVKLKIQPDEPGFLPAGILNGIRRDVLEKLTAQRWEAYPRRKIPFIANNVPYTMKKLNFHANGLNSRARYFYERHKAVVTGPAFETISDPTGKTVMNCRYCIRYQLNMCPEIAHLGSSLREPLRIRDAHHTYSLDFDCDKCSMSLILEDK